LQGSLITEETVNLLKEKSTGKITFQELSLLSNFQMTINCKLASNTSSTSAPVLTQGSRFLELITVYGIASGGLT